MNSNSGEKKTTRKWQILIISPYIVGLVWALLHPSISILTGSKVRGWFIDENSLETSHLRSNYKYLAGSTSVYRGLNRNSTSAKSLCDVLNEIQALDHITAIDCYRHGATSRSYSGPKFHLARIIPAQNTVEPSNEAIAMVVPSPSHSLNWLSSHFHLAILELLQQLASGDTPWLAKTIFLVSPLSNEQSLDETVDYFLTSYMGSYSTNTKENGFEFLPHSITHAMIRNLLVLDSQTIDDPLMTKPEIRILSQGKHGILPNLDLVTSTYSVFSRSPTSSNTRRSLNDKKAPTLLSHPSGREKQRWEKIIDNIIVNYPIAADFRQWAIQLGNLILFAQNLFSGPYAPHSLALNRGIDAITIQGRHSVRMTVTSPKSFFADYVQKLEITLHALSNLHERLHHSNALYLLIGLPNFVKHEEYLISNLLLLIPAVIRAATLCLRDIRQFDLRIMGWLLLLTFAATIFLDVSVAQQEEAKQRNAMWSLIYGACFWILKNQIKRGQGCDFYSSIQSAQLIVCLITIYVHVPICFGHVTLSYPSAFFFAPWVAFTSFLNMYQNKFCILIMMSWLILSWPPVLLLPTIFSDSCTPYIRFVYFPIHLLLSLCFMIGTIM